MPLVPVHAYSFASTLKLKELMPLFGASARARVERDRLLAELDNLKSVDEATAWAHRSLGAKNTLSAIDARLIEQRFGERLSAFGEGHSNSCGTNLASVLGWNDS